MSEEILLALPTLEADQKDLSVGEPHLIRENLTKFTDIFKLNLSLSDEDLTYPLPTGHPELVKFLEDKYNQPVIITTGAKNALGAVFYALTKLGHSTLGLRSPYWALIPPLCKMHNLEPVYSDYDQLNDFDSYLLIAPNNPDGSMNGIDKAHQLYKDNNKPLIHDGAYYTPIYLGPDYDYKMIGDVQIYSGSKMLGLSGTRTGFLLCSDPQLRHHIQDYIENMTMGVSKISQLYLLNILKDLGSDIKSFELKCFNDLKKNKSIVKNIRKDILEVPDNLEDIPGMFRWAKCNDFDAFKRAKLNVISGKPFGNEEYVRINLGFTNDVMEEIVDKLNKV